MGAGSAGLRASRAKGASCGKAGCKVAEPGGTTVPPETLLNLGLSSGLPRMWKWGEHKRKGLGHSGFYAPNVFATLKWNRKSFDSWVGLAPH